MTIEEYWVRIRRVPLFLEFDTSDGKSVIARTQDGLAVSVTKPDDLTDDEREAAIASYEMFYSPRSR